ncbi:conserved hypothetical protein [Neisseria gonorrhoeae]|uniref:Uncharacterized protein n=8 Tax=Neisseriaceae TaxID=481 RepID=A0AB74ER19_NEIGO|nr:conserved hypothetical protein [Neisseria gonorrhoeae]SCW15024.1 conserved hypothetical protein [Neisseria gonorrhoeae]SCW17690.1 conserved hypothetical protein [Neisseria gonorrhoeae]SCW20186.1 conserved hypothetical protein [Neisseria gonorrhoeae]
MVYRENIRNDKIMKAIHCQIIIIILDILSNEKNIFHNVSLYEIIFSDNGNTLTLSFTDTIEGNYFGYIKCSNILNFKLDTNNFVDYEDKEDSLFPLFIPEIELYKYQFYSEIIIDVGIIIKISAETINFEPLGK